MTLSEPIYINASDSPTGIATNRIEHICAELKDFQPKPTPPNLIIRTAENRDIDSLIALELQFEDDMRQEPISALIVSEPAEIMKADFAEQLLLEDFVTLVATINDEVVGMAYGCSTVYSKLHSGERRPINSATFAKCVVEKNHRRQGIGSALGTKTIEALRLKGFMTIVSDWRLTNIGAHESWSKLGFTPTWYRMVNE